MNVYRHMVCIDASDVAYATSALTTLYTQAEQIFALKDGKPTYPADKIAHGDVICIDFSDSGKSVSALVYRQNEKDGGIVYASAITDEEGVMLTFDEDGIYKSKQQVAGGGGGGGTSDGNVVIVDATVSGANVIIPASVDEYIAQGKAVIVRVSGAYYLQVVMKLEDHLVISFLDPNGLPKDVTSLVGVVCTKQEDGTYLFNINQDFSVVKLPFKLEGGSNFSSDPLLARADGLVGGTISLNLFGLHDTRGGEYYSCIGFSALNEDGDVSTRLHLYNGSSDYVSNVYATVAISVAYGGSGLANPAGSFTFNFPKYDTSDNPKIYFAITKNSDGSIDPVDTFDGTTGINIGSVHLTEASLQELETQAEKIPNLADRTAEQTISGAWTFTNAAGIAVGAAPDLLTITGNGISHNSVAFTFPTTGGTFATEEKYDPIIPTTLHGDAETNQVTLYHDASQLSGQTPLQLKTVGGQSLIGSGDIPLAAAQSRTSRAIYTHTISIAHSNISYAIKLFTDTDTEITSATALWSALDSSLNAMYIKSENERNIIFDFSKDSSGNITLYYLDASSSMSIEVDTEDLISDNVS